jgi:hypothetical protein
MGGVASMIYDRKLLSKAGELQEVMRSEVWRASVETEHLYNLGDVCNDSSD